MAHDTTAEVVFAGREGALSLQFAADDALPAGVRCIAITLTFGPLSGKVSTVLGLDAVRVGDELALALASTDLTGRTRFASVEGDLRVGLDLRHGKGTIVIHLAPSFGREDGHAEIRLTTDQTFLATTARQLDALIALFPKLATI